MYKTLILLGLSACTLAAPIKSRLAQAKSSDGGAGSGALDCSCDLPGAPGAGFPSQGQGQYNSYGNAATVVSSSGSLSRPDTAYGQQCETASCACAASTHSEESAATRVRTYTFNGAIDAVESVNYAEAGSANEEMVGHQLEATACLISHASNEGSSGVAAPCVCV
jgi:hypothetical protein